MTENGTPTTVVLEWADAEGNVKTVTELPATLRDGKIYIRMSLSVDRGGGYGGVGSNLRTGVFVTNADGADTNVAPSNLKGGGGDA